MPITPQEITDYALKKSGAYLDHPFGPQFEIFKVKGQTQQAGKIFLQMFMLGGQLTITVNCDAMSGQFYRQMYPGVVVRGYHCPPIQQPYFNTLPIDGQVPDDEILRMIDLSYRTVLGKMPKYVRKELLGEESPNL